MDGAAPCADLSLPTLPYHLVNSLWPYAGQSLHPRALLRFSIISWLPWILLPLLLLNPLWRGSLHRVFPHVARSVYSIFHLAYLAFFVAAAGPLIFNVIFEHLPNSIMNSRPVRQLEGVGELASSAAHSEFYIEILLVTYVHLHLIMAFLIMAFSATVGPTGLARFNLDVIPLLKAISWGIVARYEPASDCTTI